MERSKFKDLMPENRPAIEVQGNTILQIIILNALIYLIFKFIYIFYLLSGTPESDYYTEVIPWFVLPAGFGSVLQKPWTLLSFMFMHLRLWSMLTSMFWFYIFGDVLRKLGGDRWLSPLYLFGSLVGGAAYLLAYNLSPSLEAAIPSTYLLGSAPAVMAIAVAAITIAPDYRMLRNIGSGIPIWIIFVIYVGLFFATLNANTPGPQIAAFGAALTGFLYMFSVKRGYDWGIGVQHFLTWVNDLYNPQKREKKIQHQQRRKRIADNNKGITQQRIDEILDKINQEGVDHLTEEEKNILKRAGEEDFK